MRRMGLLWAVLILAAGLTACTNKQGESEAPVFITVDLPSQSGLTNLNPPRTITVPTMILTSHLKSGAATDPQGFATVQVGEYTVSYRRADGGTIVPPMQTFAAGVVLQTNGTATLSDFPILSQTAMQGTPFDQLFPFNGGVDRQTGSNEIRMFYDITFFGHTASGQRVQSETVTAVRVFIFE